MDLPRIHEALVRARATQLRSSCFPPTGTGFQFTPFVVEAHGGRPPMWVDTLTKVNPFWFDGMLRVSSQVDGKPITIQLIADTLLYVFQDLNIR